MLKLDSVLRRNNSNLSLFCKKNKLTSYQDLLDYCKIRNFLPCTEEEFIKVIRMSKKDYEQKPDREDSKTQNKGKSRTSNKRKQTTPKLPKSSD